MTAPELRPEASMLWRDAERTVFRSTRQPSGEPAQPILVVVAGLGSVRQKSAERLLHEFQLADLLDAAWAVLPLEYVHSDSALLLQDPGGDLLAHRVGTELSIAEVLRIGVELSRAVAHMHDNGVLHKDIKPSNIFVLPSNEGVRLTGFGIAARVARERTAPASPEVIAGTFAYMSPEHTGRGNRSVDARGDLYSLGVTLYELLTGSLPFRAVEPAEWIHCHLARHPAPPSDRRAGVPSQLSAIILKLLNKAVEDRYQTAAGLYRDLVECLSQWDAVESIWYFPLGLHDHPSELRFGQELYGRDAELDVLKMAYQRVVASGMREVVLVSGYSGVGKSSLVNDLHKVVAADQGRFAAGKFDQYKHGIPYATFAQAFKSLVRELLGKREEELEQWRTRLRDALGAHGQLIVNLVPELELLIGEQIQVPELSGGEARVRFLLVVRQFLSVFASAERPLVLFLDDLQWLDAATLNAFESLATHPDARNLLLVGTYRSNEVDADHTLQRSIDAIRNSGAPLHEVVLSGIRPEEVAQMIAEPLRCSYADVSALAACVHEKTGGNPLFAQQFVATLADDGSLSYDTSQSRWRWDLQRIREQRATENIAELMIERVRRLPYDALSAMHMLACIGCDIEKEFLGLVLEEPLAATHERLQEALRLGLVVDRQSAYSFAHDRVHEAAYGMVPESDRAQLHLRIGTSLLRVTHDEDLDDHIFEIASHFNKAGRPTLNPDQRAATARLNLRAGRRARASSAYIEACRYLDLGRTQIGESAWRESPELAFELALEHAECCFLGGKLAETSGMVKYLLSRASRPIDVAASYRLKVELHVVSTEYEEAVQSGLIALRQLGIDIPPHPSADDVQREYSRVWASLNGRPIDVIADLPTMMDPARQASMRLLAELWPPSYFTDFNLVVMIICKMVNVSLLHGSTRLSNQGFALLGWLMGHVFGRFEDGYRLCRLAYELAAKRDSVLDHGRTCMTMALTSAWTQPLDVSLGEFRRAIRLAAEAGDLYFSCYCGMLASSQLLMRGRGLAEGQEECRRYLKSADDTGFRDGSAVIATVERTFACLLGETRSLADFTDDKFDGAAFEASLTTSRMSVLIQWYWTRKTMLYFLAGEFDEAVAASRRVDTGPFTRFVQIEYLEHHHFSALAICAAMSRVPEQQRHSLRATLGGHYSAIRQWAQDTRSATFSDKLLLVEAEMARLEGRWHDAEILYEQSANAARRNGFMQGEALACELASRCYLDRGVTRAGYALLREAIEAYRRWGAKGKVAQLEAAYPELLRPSPETFAPATTAAPVEQIELESVLKGSISAPSEIVGDELITTLMRTVVKHAGAERGLLLAPKGDELEIEAEALTTGESLEVKLRIDRSLSQSIAETIVRFAIRSRESVIVDDAMSDPRLAADPGVRRRRVRSVLCLPLLSSSKLQSVLYLENNLAPGVFTASHLEVFKLLAAHAAVSLENARLYRELAARESRIRRLVESDVIGIVFWDVSGQLLDANDAFLQMLGYTRQELESGSLRWYDMTPPEWHEQVNREVQELNETGALRPVEKEYFHKDGTRIPCLLGAATFEETQTKGVAIVVDLRKQKAAEARAVEVERRNRLLQTDLAHANRVTTMGELAAWISHDVRQPLVGVVSGANAGLRWLATDPPNVAAAARSLERIVRDGMYAGEVLDRTRALFKKLPPKAENIDINPIIVETLALVRPQAERKGVEVLTRLADAGAVVSADRTQIQQVILNFLVNAIEAMESNESHPRELLIKSWRKDGSIRVDVIDTGPGLSADASHRLFEAFYTTKPEGLGMGLRICKAVVESFNGSIGAVANADRGSNFYFELPEAGG
ncbi:AAA family ATPase [Variovorax sp. J2P1-59]|uniref:trifunctional serine/threonine-protein kinase/ATP-binding protein/sensor histidine kinase n=1 Tax=Variovorax flavidus TaxID=3053501 RepID=UPI002576D05D|nr:AAA family ATPase [Variovorax sp. J2P1-59]MDM0078897.1 AAA family ATPase [Variovorax sp. J2P1-59]